MNWKYIKEVYKNNFTLDFSEIRKKKNLDTKYSKLNRQGSFISNISASRMGGERNSNGNSRRVIKNPSLIYEEEPELDVSRRHDGGRKSIDSPIRLNRRYLGLETEKMERRPSHQPLPMTEQ